jgi:YgiT-type zinc finger domain-containing protein
MKHQKRKPESKCAICGVIAARVLPSPKVFGRGSKRVLIEDIPYYHCSNCHSQYVDGPTMDLIDEIRKNPAAYSHQESIATVKFAA